MNDWIELAKMTQGAKMVIERVRLKETGIKVEGEFELPSLAQLTAEEQVFISSFIQVHGSIKEMEKLFGISYPTVKNRLNQISKKLKFIVQAPVETKKEILDQLESGELSVEETLQRLQQ